MFVEQWMETILSFSLCLMNKIIYIFSFPNDDVLCIFFDLNITFDI
jgi:hypothetical protein